MILSSKYTKIVDLLPRNENFALADQLRRAVVSVPSNIAEGQKRGSRKEVVQFSRIALGSLAETETQLIIVNRVYSIDTTKELELASQVGRMLSGLTKSLRD